VALRRQQVGLAGDVVDELNHLADLMRRADQALDRGVGALGAAAPPRRRREWDWVTCWLISAIDFASSSAAAATVPC